MHRVITRQETRRYFLVYYIFCKKKTHKHSKEGRVEPPDTQKYGGREVHTIRKF